MPFSAYVICATPRSGSTLLCDLLEASGAAGRPQSYFRSQDIAYWAQEWDITGSIPVFDQEFDRAYIAAMRRAGTADTDMFGMRLMWDSVGEASRRLDAALGGQADIVDRLEQAFGPTLFIHLSRRDKIAQAVSLARAQQTGLWHINADGSDRERTAPAQVLQFDIDAITAACDTLTADDGAWSSFFDERGVKPFLLSYEGLAADPRSTLAGLLAAFGLDPMHANEISAGTAKIADAVSAEWVERMMSETPSSDTSRR